MIARLVGIGALLSLVACCAAVQPAPAGAALNDVMIAINYNNTQIKSTSATTMAIVANGGVSYIECYFQTAGGQVGLRLTSADQRRVEAFFQQVTTAASGTGRPFQITAYASSTYQSYGYTANLDTDLVYLILH